MKAISLFSGMGFERRPWPPEGGAARSYVLNRTDREAPESWRSSLCDTWRLLDLPFRKTKKVPRFFWQQVSEPLPKCRMVYRSCDT